ncbi:MAG TPA: hypothetical protein VLJ39_22740, partial [Tepidisphaeraceae bacterium]|nr:hypothetical protein [Tepidisphaeraceae bacterium]
WKHLAMRLSILFAFLLVSFMRPAHAQTVTWSEHIAPIIYNNCTTCHRPGQVSALPLMSYDDVRRRGSLVGQTVQTRYMPPWKPEPGWVAYKDERRLTAPQIALITKWVEDGMPRGDTSKEPQVPAFVDDWQLGKPDLVLEMATGFAVPADGPDIYRNFVLPAGLTEDKWVKAIELKPSARQVVHHVLFASDKTGSASAEERRVNDGQPGFPGLGSVFTIQAASDPLGAVSGGLGGWVPGATPSFLPAGIAMPLPKNSDLILQTHFHPNGASRVEKTVVGLYFGPPPDRQVTQFQVPAFFGVTSHIDIPPGVKDYKVRGSFTVPADVDAVVVSAHAHYLAKEAKLTATLPTGEVKILLWIREWDFNWQDQYLYKDLLSLPKGTRLDGELTYDNSADNPRNPNSPPKRVTWGEQSTDEMGSMILVVVPKNEADLDGLRLSVINYVLTPVPQVGNRPLFLSSGMVDGASTQPGAVTPGKIVVLYGSRIGPSNLTPAQLGPDGHLATSLGGTQVLFDGQPAPLLYASSGQLAAVVPYSVDGKLGTQVQVKNGTNTSDLVAMPVSPVAPSIFSADYTGSGQGAILNQDGVTVNSVASPAAKGSIVSIYATGEGQTNPGGVDGQLATDATLPKPKLPVQVWINGKSADVLYSGTAPGQVAGLFEVNAKIPDDTSAGEVSLQVQVGNAFSQPGITVVVK